MCSSLEPVRLNLEEEYERQHADLARQMEQRAWFRAVSDRGEAVHCADAVDVPRDQVPAEAVGQAERLFQVDFRPRHE